MADKYDSFANKMLDSKDFKDSNIADASFESILKDICKKNDSFKSLALLEEDFSNPLNVYCPSGARAAVAAAMATKKPVVLVVPSGRDALESLESIRDFYNGDPKDIANLEAWETLPHERLSPRADTVASRMAVFRRLKHPQSGEDGKSGKSSMFSPIRVLVMPVRSLIQPVVKDLCNVEPLVFECGNEISIELAAKRLVENSYNRVELVMNRAEFAVRGGIIDVFPPTMDHPVRIEFFGDEIDSIKQFHASDQRTYG
ncbi:transcription-repair coupling factor, partial [Gardnerella vaginalis]